MDSGGVGAPTLSLSTVGMAHAALDDDAAAEEEATFAGPSVVLILLLELKLKLFAIPMIFGLAIRLARSNQQLYL